MPLRRQEDDVRWLARLITLVLLGALALAGGRSASVAETAVAETAGAEPPQHAAQVQFIEFYSPM